MQHTAFADLALAVDRGDGRMRCADFVHELADGEDLPDRADEEIVIGSEIDEHFAGLEVNNAESPDRVLVQWLVEYRLDVRGDVRAAAVVAASNEAECCGYE